LTFLSFALLAVIFIEVVPLRGSYATEDGETFHELNDPENTGLNSEELHDLEWNRLSVLDANELPLNVNEAGYDLLIELPGFTDELVRSLLWMREKRGGFGAVEELREIPGMSPEIIARAEPFLFVPSGAVEEKQGSLSCQGLIRHYWKYPLSDELLRNRLSRYHGRMYQKWNISWKSRITGGLVFERDEGEKLRWDHRAFFIRYLGDGFLQTFILGHFHATFACGLTVSHHRSPGEVPWSYSKSRTRGTVSLNENLPFRGLLGVLKAGGVETTLLLSHAPVDASVQADSTLNFRDTGTHRTHTELQKRHAAAVRIAGGRVCFSNDIVCIGSSCIRCFSHYRKRSPVCMPGKATHYGTDISVTLNRLRLSGEFSKIMEGGTAFAAMVKWSVDRVTASLGVYRYTRNFAPLGNLRSNSSEGPGTCMEAGIRSNRSQWWSGGISSTYHLKTDGVTGRRGHEGGDHICAYLRLTGWRGWQIGARISARMKWVEEEKIIDLKGDESRCAAPEGSYTTRFSLEVRHWAEERNSIRVRYIRRWETDHFLKNRAVCDAIQCTLSLPMDEWWSMAADATFFHSSPQSPLLYIGDYGLSGTSQSGVLNGSGIRYALSLTMIPVPQVDCTAKISTRQQHDTHWHDPGMNAHFLLSMKIRRN
jgi:hypothetical protein